MTFSFAPISLGHKKTQDELDEALVGGQKKLDQDKDGDIDAKDFAMLRGKKKKKKNEDEPEGDNGETASMNPKMATAKEGAVKEYGMVYANKHKKGKMKADEGHMDKKKHPSYYENQKNEGVNEVSFRPNDDTSLGNRYANKVMSGDYSSKKTDNRKKGIATMVYKRAAQKGVPGVAKVPFKDHVEKDENMSIREKLISVVERANHGNMDSKETYDDMYHGAGAKKMRKDHQNMKVDTTRKLGVDDASKAGKATKKAPMRRADNAKGDTNIVPAGTPMKDPSASKDMALENVMAAYKSMSEVSMNTLGNYIKKRTDDVDKAAATKAFSSPKFREKATRDLPKYKKGVKMAVDKMTGKAKVPAGKE